MRHYPHPFSRDEAAQWISRQEERYARDGYGLWILHDHDGAFVGDCGLTWQTVDGQKRTSRSATTCLARTRVRGWPPRPPPPAATTRGYVASTVSSRSWASTTCPSRRVAERIGLAVERETTYAGLPVLLLSAAW